MRKTILFSISLLALSGCFTFGQAPEIGQAEVTPSVLAPDSSGLITVVINDAHNIVDRVEGVVQVEPPVRIPLYDDGTHGDAEAGDGAWSIQVPVPGDAPAGNYEIVFTAYTDDGLPVEVRGRDRKVVVLRTSLPFVIAKPGE